MKYGRVISKTTSVVVGINTEIIDEDIVVAHYNRNGYVLTDAGLVDRGDTLIYKKKKYPINKELDFEKQSLKEERK